MLISFVYAVFDDRAVRGLKEGSEPKLPPKLLLGAGEPGAVHWKALPGVGKKKRGQDERREQYAFGLGPTRLLHPPPDGKAPTTKRPAVTIKQWDPSWPKVSFVADVNRQGRFVSSAAKKPTVVRPMLKLNGVSIEPRAARQYTFHQNCLALFSFSFLFQGKAKHEHVIDAVRALGLQLVEFRLGSLVDADASAPATRDLDPVVSLSNCRGHLACVHATSAFSQRYRSKNIAHLTPLQPLVFIHDANSEIEDWPVPGPITCQEMGPSIAFALRPRKKCTTWALQSFVCAQILEGEALHHMTDYVIKNRKILTERKEKWRKRAAKSSISSSAKARDDAQDAIPADVRPEISTYFADGKNGVLDGSYDATIERIKRLKNAELRDSLKEMLGVNV